MEYNEYTSILHIWSITRAGVRRRLRLGGARLPGGGRRRCGRARGRTPPGPARSPLPRGCSSCSRGRCSPGARAGPRAPAPRAPPPPDPLALLAGAPPGALGQVGTLLDVLGGGLFPPPRAPAEGAGKLPPDPTRFAAEARTVLAPVDAAFEEFFPFPRGHSFGELLAAKSPRVSLSRLSLHPSRVVSLVRGHFLRDLVPDPRTAASAGGFESFGGSKVAFYVDDATGGVGVRDGCGTTSRVVEGPLLWRDPVSGNDRALYLLDDLLVPSPLCSYGF